ncbi:MAG: pchR 1 [Firmicutes bacterium]|nr:pchR 1 [Bacillota bacterium]
MKILLNTTNLNDFYLKLNEIGFLHKTTAHVHEFEVLNKFGNGYIRRYSYQNDLHLSIGSMTLQKDLTYSFNVEHKYFELVYVHSGYMEIFNESTQQLERINRGEFTLFVAQGCKGWARLPQHEHLDFITITIEEEYIHALKEKGVDLTTKMPLFQKHPAIHHPQKLTIDIENLVNKIFLCPYDDETIKKMFYEAVVLEILSESLFRSTIQENVPKLPVPLDNTDMERLYMAKQVLAERMTNPPSIEELSKIVCLNTFKLKTGFKAVFADTIYGYLRRTRMEKAKLLLKNTQLSIHDIALQLGYCNGSSLSAIFKEHYGIPPKQYRKR